jgi:predicted PurR-regulated permease PerM
MTAQQAFRNTLVVLLTLALAYALVLSIRIVIVFLLAIIVASAVRPLVLRLRRWRFPPGLAILFVYSGIGLAILILFLVVLPPVIRQFIGYLANDSRLANQIIAAQSRIERLISETTGDPVTLINPDEIRVSIAQITDQINRTVPTMIGQITGLLGEFILVFVMGVYWLTSRDKAVNFIVDLFPLSRRARINAVINEIESSLGTFVRGVVLVATFVGTANFLVLLLLGVPNAATLGFIIGITTTLPVVGGFLGGGTATLLALLESPLNGLIVFGVFTAIQQIEIHYLTPRVMSRSVGLDPLLIVVAVFTGFALNGVIGALLAVPISGVVCILLRSLIIEPRKARVSSQTLNRGILLAPVEPDAERVIT